MAELYRMPDLPIDFIRFLHGDEDYIIFKEKYFIKRLRRNRVNVDALLDIADLNIEGFNNHKRVFIDDLAEFIFLNAPYLGDHQDMITATKQMDQRNILLLYKKLFANLKNAHKNGFFPYDIKFSNYLISPDNNPIFSDFDFTVYKGKCTQEGDYYSFYTGIDAYGIKRSIDSIVTITNNDKLLALQMLLQSLDYHYECIMGQDTEKTQILLEMLISKYKIDSKVEKHLEQIVTKHNLPEKDDYFIDSIINPLLEDGLSLKKTTN